MPTLFFTNFLKQWIPFFPQIKPDASPWYRTKIKLEFIVDLEVNVEKPVFFLHMTLHSDPEALFPPYHIGMWKILSFSSISHCTVTLRPIKKPQSCLRFGLKTFGLDQFFHFIGEGAQSCILSEQTTLQFLLLFQCSFCYTCQLPNALKANGSEPKP